MYDRPIHQCLQLARQRWNRVEEHPSFLDGHLQGFVDAFALVLDLQGFAVITLALAHVTRHVDVRQKVHLYLDQAIALARFAAPALDVEREPARPITPRAGFRYAGEQFANRREQPGISRRVGARRTANRALVDVDDFVQMLKALDAVVRSRFQGGRAVQGGGAQWEQRVVDQRRLARTGYTGHTGQ